MVIVRLTQFPAADGAFVLRQSSLQQLEILRIIGQLDIERYPASLAVHADVVRFPCGFLPVPSPVAAPAYRVANVSSIPYLATKFDDFGRTLKFPKSIRWKEPFVRSLRVCCLFQRFPNCFHLSAEWLQQFRSHTVFFLQQAEKEMLRADVPMTKPLRFPQRVLQNTSCGLAQRKVNAR